MSTTEFTPLRSRVRWPVDVPAPIPAGADEPLVLPDAPPASRRSSLPLLASVVPVVGAVGLWVVTGSILSLWFALLGPLIAAASIVDGRRGARRDRRRAEVEAAAARERVTAEIERRHRRERDRAWSRHPDVRALVGDDRAVWRPETARGALVVGRGTTASAVRVLGGAGDSGAVETRARAGSLNDAPVTVPLVGGIAVVGPPVPAAAVVRSLIAQACLLLPPGELRLVASASGETGWTTALPHRRAAGALTVGVVLPGEPAPRADALIARVDPDSPPPPACGAVLTLRGVDRGVLVVEGTATEVEVESIGAVQAADIADDLAARAAVLYPPPPALAAVTLSEVLGAAPQPQRGGLPAVIGVDHDGAPVVVDLVRDGPHAVVTGVTGSGKSELLITWVTALCATHTAAEVVFLLADFKGGTAFDALRALPHVTGVLTDLDGVDGGGARRAIESLRAEVRRRESALAEVGARDVLDPRAALPRLVVVVDEFAALLAEHPEIQSVFVDVAARGRALGMHLILGTQRVTGTVRDALLANCPLRISLRVTDAADSRTVIGTDEASRLPGDQHGRALVRRAADGVPQSARVALTDGGVIDAIAARAAASPPPSRPWLPELPRHVDLSSLPLPRDREAGTVLLGLADRPDRQEQAAAMLGPHERGLLVVGMAGSGRTTALAAVAAQVPAHDLRRVPRDPERAWDALSRIDRSLPPGTTVVIDDLDALLAEYPLEHAHVVAERVERLVRGAGDRGIRVVISAQRLTGATARIAELLPRRAILATPTRAEHVAAGGDGALWARAAAPGRAQLDGESVQLAYAAVPAPGPSADPAPVWQPGPGVSGIVARRGTASVVASGLRARGATVVTVDDVVPFAESARPLEAEGSAGVVAVGDPDVWQRSWRALTAIRAEHELVIDASCATEYRLLTGDREPPPYCVPRAGRAWLLAPGEPTRRVRFSDDPNARHDG